MRWRATPISVDTPEAEQFAQGFELELHGEYVSFYWWRFSGRTREKAIERATRWMERQNARADKREELTTEVKV